MKLLLLLLDAAAATFLTVDVFELLPLLKFDDVVVPVVAGEVTV